MAETGNYPAWICAPCGERYGKPSSKYSTWHGGDRCGWCGELAIVTEPRDFGYPAAVQPEAPDHG